MRREKRAPQLFCEAQVVDKPYEEVSEGHHDPLTGFVSTGYAGRGGSAKGETIPSIFHGRQLC